jgi:dGTPase
MKIKAELFQIRYCQGFSKRRRILREVTYRIEEQFLSRYASKSRDTKGRDRPEEPCPMRTDYQRDRDRILHSKSFRRLKNKTQVFLSPEGDHYRTRLTHTLDVSQIGRSIARALCLNEDLTEAIALGHDLGHTPFGHAGEATLQRLTGGAFEHSRQSLRVVEVLENNGCGLNLTKEVRNGILNHQLEGNPNTLEGRVVCLADKIAYINHDIDDALRAGLLKNEDLPKDIIAVLGGSSRERINTMIMSIYKASFGKNTVEMEKDIGDATLALRKFLFERVYKDNEAKAEEEKADRMIEILYNFFMKNPARLPEFYLKLSEKYGQSVSVCDYISSMSDRYAVYTFEKYFVPSSWKLDKN